MAKTKQPDSHKESDMTEQLNWAETAWLTIPWTESLVGYSPQYHKELNMIEQETKQNKNSLTIPHVVMKKKARRTATHHWWNY